MLLPLPGSLLHSFSSPVTQQLLFPPKSLASSLSDVETAIKPREEGLLGPKRGLWFVSQL